MTTKNISLLGATYSNVPGVTLPVSGGGSATFYEISDTTAAASDVASGKYFYTSAGVKTEGTNSGGGGAGYTLLWSGEISLSSVTTSATTLQTLTNITGAWDSSKVLYLCARNKVGKANNMWVGNDVFAVNDQEYQGYTSTLTNSCLRGWVYKMNWNSTMVSVNDGISVGVYMSVAPNAISIKGKSASTTTGTLTSITADVKLYALDWANGISPFYL